MSSCSRIALTAGEPAGIGPDLCIQLAQQQQECELVVIADPDLLQQRAQQLGLDIVLEPTDLSIAASIPTAGTLRYLPIKLAATAQAGQLNSLNADYVLRTLQCALDGCLDESFDAVVTGPVHKGIINEAEVSFTGHTEFFADGSNTEQVVMMLATPSLRVALVTTHLPLIDISAAITQQTLTQVIEITHSAIQQQFGIE